MPRTARGMLAGGIVVALAGLAGAQSPPIPFTDPPFAAECVVHQFGEGEAPPVEGIPDDPLCVEYQKRDITGTNGGAVLFLAAEPARFAAAIPKCRYWQQDHWSVQVAPGTPPLIGWDGSYWFDKGNGTGAARLRNFAIGGQPASPGQVADLIEAVSPDMAAVIRQYGEDAGGGGASFCLGQTVPGCERDNPRCGESPCDAQAVAATRAMAETECDCTGAANNSFYVRCASELADREAAAGRLPDQCRSEVVRCSSSSVCGRPGWISCCRTNARGITRCRPKRSAVRCRAPHHGSACTSPRASCCDACVGTSCAQ